MDILRKIHFYGYQGKARFFCQPRLGRSSNFREEKKGEKGKTSKASGKDSEISGKQILDAIQKQSTEIQEQI